MVFFINDLENIELTASADINATGNASDNIITGNSGNNILDGQAGADTYKFSLGLGNDTIVDSAGIDNIEFDTGIASGDLSYSKTGDDLVIDFSATNDVITVQNWFLDNLNKIETLNFSDSTIVTSTEIDDIVLSGQGASDDLIYGTPNDDTFKMNEFRD